jgi:tRNA(Ile)-lysidine synthetase-like protein
MKNPVELSFIETIRREGILPRCAHVTAAVSGGADSVGLLLLLDRFRSHMKWDLRALHIDHRWRPESISDARFVEALCGRLGVPFVLREIGSATPACSPEADFSARRQGIYEQVAEDGLVAVGHTATDRAETLLLRLLEGAGLRGLGGMDYVGIGPVRRPMLDLSRSAVRGYLEQRGEAWVEDPTNSDQAMLRNRIRALVLPALEKTRPGADLQLSRSGASLASWRRVADAASSVALEFCTSRGAEAGAAALDRSRWLSQELALRLSMIWILCGRPRSGFDEIEKTERWLAAGGKGVRNLPSGVRLEAGEGALRFFGADRGAAVEPG